jgi:hypothetical protein
VHLIFLFTVILNEARYLLYQLLSKGSDFPTQGKLGKS